MAERTLTRPWLPEEKLWYRCELSPGRPVWYGLVYRLRRNEPWQSARVQLPCGADVGLHWFKEQERALDVCPPESLRYIGD